MPDDIISMDDMMAVFEVTDRFGIDREQISVPLEKSGLGAVRLDASGGLEIVVPAQVPTRAWLPDLQSELERMGFQAREEDEEF